MTVRSRMIPVAAAVALTLTLLALPALPVAADEVGSGWTTGVFETVGGWFAEITRLPEWGIDHPQQRPSSDPGSTDHEEPASKTGMTNEGQTCDSEAHPSSDPLGQC